MRSARSTWARAAPRPPGRSLPNGRSAGLPQRLAIEAVDRFACRQANARILVAVARTLEVSEERVVMNVDRVGNTVAASIPLVLTDAAAAATSSARISAGTPP
ncbi:3-oxoacyl-[acyl-carrier-protein] synthase III C-terminal domain-containing protein [Lentzea sp. CC55]|uniref:3-oxoacyl-[acyl-carrier-protein] synthase III C-terminal domain-containing protein n=1 Tax=Lentzea sp. CC55 TaxID=2884909 RepID=UPI0035AEC00D